MLLYYLLVLDLVLDLSPRLRTLYTSNVNIVIDTVSRHTCIMFFIFQYNAKNAAAASSPKG